MKTIILSDDLRLPLDIITMRIAVYGDSGAGKTTFARLLAEKIHGANHRFCAIDLKNDWWGLKSSADGSKAGIPVVVFGGPRADVKLVPDQAAAIALAETVASIDQSVIIDLDAMSRTKQERFLAPFLDALYESNRRPLLMFCDEADRYAPQKPMTKDAIDSLSSSEDIARRGRKRGIGSFWLTQRTAVLNKNVSEFANLTVVFRTPGEKDLRELEDRVGRIAGKEVVKEVMRLAPGLADGEAIFLSAHPKLRPFMPNPVRPIQLPMPWTFDSSATPGVGQRRREPKVLAKADLAAIESKLSAQVEQAKQEDPKALRVQIGRLQLELDRLRAARTPKVETKTQRVEVSVVKTALVSRIESAIKQLTGRADAMVDAGNSATKVATDLIVALSSARRNGEASPDPTPSQFSPPRFTIKKPVMGKAAAAPSSEADHIVAGDSGAISEKSGKRRLLIALAQFPNGLTARKLAILSTIKRTGGTYRTYMTDLRKSGWLQGTPKLLKITAAGRAACGDYKPLPTGAKLIEHWQSELGDGGKRSIFDALLSAYPGSLSREKLCEATGMAPGGGTYRTYMTELRGLELLEGDPSAIKLSDELFQ